MFVGYARVSTHDQDPAFQLDAQEQAGCERVFTQTTSGAQRERPKLKPALDYMRSADTLVVWRLNRLGWSLKQLIEPAKNLLGLALGRRRDRVSEQPTLAVSRRRPKTLPVNISTRPNSANKCLREAIL